MTIVMKNKFSTALAIATVMSMGYSTLSVAASPESITFTPSIHVTSPFSCEYETGLGGSTPAWSVNWNLASRGDAHGVLTFNDAKEPIDIQIHALGADTSCTLNNMHLTVTKAGDALVVGGGSLAFKMPTENGYWQYVPLLSRVQLFTDSNYATPSTGNAKVSTADGETNESGVTVTTAGQQMLSTVYEWINWGSTQGGLLSDGYMVNDDGFAALTGPDGASNPVTFTPHNGTDQIRSMKIGITAIIGRDPIDETGNVKVDGVSNGDTVDLPFTVNVTYI